MIDERCIHLFFFFPKHTNAVTHDSSKTLSETCFLPPYAYKPMILTGQMLIKLKAGAELHPNPKLQGEGVCARTDI